MKDDNIKIIGGGLIAVEIEIEINDEIPIRSQYNLDMVKKNKEQIEYLKTIKKMRGGYK